MAWEARQPQEPSFAGLETLEARTLLSAAPGADAAGAAVSQARARQRNRVDTVREVEPNDRRIDATVFTIDQKPVWLRGKIRPLTEKDFFRFTAAEDVTVRVTSIPRFFHWARAIVLNDQGRVVASTNPFGSRQQVEFRAEVGRDYLIRVSAGDVRFTNNYIVQVETVEATNVPPGNPILIGEIEPNNRRNQATPFQMNAGDTAIIIANNPDSLDIDQYKFRAPATGRIKVTLRPLNSRPATVTLKGRFGVDVGIATTDGSKAAKFVGDIERGQRYTFLETALSNAKTQYQIVVKYIELT